MRGDVPHYFSGASITAGFSPRARGCSWLFDGLDYNPKVFPACAGMFPVASVYHVNPTSFPRVRGDVPSDPTPPAGGLLFSPRARGCSWVVFPQFSACLVFPRARGCSEMGINAFDAQGVFPACAGMFRPRRRNGYATKRFPRVRGDVPRSTCWDHSPGWFSPRARGCSSRPPPLPLLA